MREHNNIDILGHVVGNKINDKLMVLNLYGQKYYGRQKKCYTSYAAHRRAWGELAYYMMDYKIYAPYYIGAALAGGDWQTIHDIAELHVPDIIWVKYKK